MKILCFIVNRANYGRLAPVLELLNNDLDFDLTLVATGTTVESKFGLPVESFEKDGLIFKYKLPIEHGERTHKSMAYTTSNAIKMACDTIETEVPDLILIIGDRYETLGIAIAGSYMNVPIAHLQGGELSGSIDDNIRHSISKLANYHFVATKRSKEIVCQLGEDPINVFNVGCPCGDYIMAIGKHSKIKKNELIEKITGINELDEYILVCYHPTTTTADIESSRIKILCQVVCSLKKTTIWIKPNSDAGSDHIEEELNKLDSRDIHLFSNISHREYIILMRFSSLCLGNSSSFLRDSSFIGIPVVLVGERQNLREYSSNVIHPNFSTKDLLSACEKQLNQCFYPPSNLYGDGKAAERIVALLKKLQLNHLKKFHKL